MLFWASPIQSNSSSFLGFYVIFFVAKNLGFSNHMEFTGSNSNKSKDANFSAENCLSCIIMTSFKNEIS